MTFPIVAIAASAGGLEALSELLGELPAKSGMAFVVVQHLDPTHESLLTEILSKRASIRVRQAEEGALVDPDHVYVIPPNTALTLRGDGRLHLGPRGHGRDRHMPGDILFRSLAEDTRGNGHWDRPLWRRFRRRLGYSGNQARRWYYLRARTRLSQVSGHAEARH